jgi:guanosine-3',5'-bis(diphosphate) 3'-pyrophosphohydrolase
VADEATAVEAAEASADLREVDRLRDAGVSAAPRFGTAGTVPAPNGSAPASPAHNGTAASSSSATAVSTEIAPVRAMPGSPAMPGARPAGRGSPSAPGAPGTTGSGSTGGSNSGGSNSGGSNSGGSNSGGSGGGDGGGAGSRMLSRLARLGASRQSNPVLDPIFRILKAQHPKADTSVVERAYEVAERCHRDQFRRSGDPYITHPLAVATILAELGMTESTLCAALLHDTVEDTDYTLDMLRASFGAEVAHLVDGVTKLDKVTYGADAQAETVRKMVVAMARDIRVLVIKLADRLHNMRTLHHLRPEKRERIAKETLEIYAPLAHRLGMNTLKWELEDLAFAVLNPKIYNEIVRMVADRAPSREEYLRGVTAQVTDELKTAKIRATVTGRPKHYFSVYQKMIVRGRDFSEIYDLVGIRILVDSVRDCYSVLGAMHARFSPVPGRFKDYIAMPKFNLYQSLHTTVIGPEGKPVELQIRTWAMHRRAEYGVAAHWKYKEEQPNKSGDDPSPSGVGEHPSDMSWLRQLLDWQRETADPGEFLDALRFEISANEVYVFTPKGDVFPLPAGSTPVDFAYAVHTEVGHHCIGAKVNGRLVPLESSLDTGDVVEIFTSKSSTAGPSRDWLGFVKSPRARAKIRQWFTRERREEAVETGRTAIARQMRKENLPLQRLLTHESLTAVAQDLRHADVSALYAAVGEGQISAQAVVARVVKVAGGEDGATEDLAEAVHVPPGGALRGPRNSGDPGVVVKGVDDVWVKLAKCCTPVPGDDVFGFVTRGHGVSVHRTDCTNATALAAEPERRVEVEWAPTASSQFLVSLQVEALDRSRLLSDVTRVLSDQHVNILSASVSTTRDRVAKSRFMFEMGDPRHLATVLKAVRTIDGVFDVYRITSTKQD